MSLRERVCPCGRPIPLHVARTVCLHCHARRNQERYASDPELRERRRSYQRGYRLMLKRRAAMLAFADEYLRRFVRG